MRRFQVSELVIETIHHLVDRKPWGKGRKTTNKRYLCSATSFLPPKPYFLTLLELLKVGPPFVDHP